MCTYHTISMKNEWKSVEKSVCEMWMCVCVCAPTDPSIDHFWIRCYFTHINVAVFRTANMLHFSSLLHFHSNLASHCRIRCKTSCKFRENSKLFMPKTYNWNIWLSIEVLVFWCSTRIPWTDAVTFQGKQTKSLTYPNTSPPSHPTNQPTDHPVSQPG